MKIHYKLSIPDPSSHLVEIRMTGSRDSQTQKLRLFLPVWSPGSYLVREYARHIFQIRAVCGQGQPLSLVKTSKCEFEIDWQAPHLTSDSLDFEVHYQVYCHELTVRTSHVDSTHAFLHGPSLFLGLHDVILESPTVEIMIPPQWNKISTGLKDISTAREKFLYQALNYDELIDSPIEIGCQETDGFMIKGVPHELAFYGEPMGHDLKIKNDIKKIVETVLETTKDIPYEKYVFMTHFAPALFGGLEHLNSTALQYCPLKLLERKGYLGWLALVAHEYFHTWNVKRIRPKELGPFDYTQEAMTTMHWLTEGLTSFVDELFVVRSGLCTLEEYLEMQRMNLNRYFATPGRRYHSLEDSSYLTWIKLYRPDANSANSSVSYYLKGGLVFTIFHQMLFEKGLSIDHFIQALWKRYLDNPGVGVDRAEVLSIIQELTGESGVENFETMIATTQELALEQCWNKMGVDFEYDHQPTKGHLGVRWSPSGERVMFDTVEIDGPAYKSGLSAGDELVAVDGWRITRNTLTDFEAALKPQKSYHFCVSRSGRLVELDVRTESFPKTTLKCLKIRDKDLLARSLGVKLD
jgi:predicted metalloprotease with PDZ domain